MRSNSFDNTKFSVRIMNAKRNSKENDIAKRNKMVLAVKPPPKKDSNI